MNKPLRAGLAAIVMLGCFTLAGCSKMSGKYQDSTGVMSVEFKDGKAYLTTMGTTQEADFDVDGNNVTIKGPTGNLVLTKNSDGTLSGPLGVSLKKVD